MINKYSILNGAKYFSFHGSQNYSAFQLFLVTMELKTRKIALWQSKGMSEKDIKPPSTTSDSFNPEITNIYDRKIFFKGICLTQDLLLMEMQ